MNELALFAGAGGGILGGKLLGWTTVCAVEINVYRARRLMQRQNEGHLSPFPVWDDVRTFDGHKWKGCVDVVSGGFPCQDISSAGTGAGLEGERSGLWVEMARIIDEVRPRFVLVENSPMLTSRGLGRILGDLAEIRFDARWGSFTARDEGAPIERERLFIACANKEYGEERLGFFKEQQAAVQKRSAGQCPGFWLQAPPDHSGMVNGVANYVESVGAIGDGQVPAVVKTAWETLIFIKT
ncbi:MAG: DNA cytosine methyltransferase [Candidatus Thiodiazotropha sp.]